jgi:hypothetical protein
LRLQPVRPEHSDRDCNKIAWELIIIL